MQMWFACHFFFLSAFHNEHRASIIVPVPIIFAGVAKVIVDARLPINRCGGVKTITIDNGTEFYEHDYISCKLNAPLQS